MNNLIEQLRNYRCDQLSSCWWTHPSIVDKAADEIERLTRERDAARTALDELYTNHDKAAFDRAHAVLNGALEQKPSDT